MEDRSAAVQPVRDRIEALDFLRGLALLGIYLSIVHGFNHSYAPMPEGTPDGGAMDRFFGLLHGVFINKRFIGLLSLLFGLGIAIQQRNFQNKAQPFAPYFVKRMLILAVFGLATTTFYFNGEILLVYAVFGLVTLAIARLGDKVILVVAFLAFFVWGEFFEIVFRDDFIRWMSPFIEAYPYARVEEIYRTGTLWEMIPLRWLEYIYIYTDNGYHLGMSLAMILGGYWIGIKELHKRILNDLDWGRESFAVAAIFTVLFAVYQLATRTDWFFLGDNAVLFVLYTLFIASSLYTYVYMAVWSRNAVGSNVLVRALERNGRLSLTGYMGGALAYSFIFYNTGFSLFARYGYTVQLGIALAVYLGFTLFATLWLRKFERGPMEWVFRRLAYGRLGKVEG